MSYSNRIFWFFLLLSLGNNTFFSQQNDKIILEEKRKTLKNDIEKIKKYIEKTNKKETNLSNQVADLTVKMNTRQKLISNMDSEIDLISGDINKNERIIKKNENELKKLKKDYAEMIFKSYKNRGADNQLLFILSSGSFQQVYLRFQYLKQYSKYRKKQGEFITQKTLKLKTLTDSLTIKKKSQEVLLNEKKEEQKVIEIEKEQKQDLIKKFQKQKKDYQTQIQKKQKEEKLLADVIENLIKTEIKKSAVKTNSETSKTAKTSKKKNEFTLAPEAKELAGQFAANKGKLPWPVDKGIVTVGFGKQPDPMDPKLFLDSSGVRIATESGQNAQSVFDGVVLAIQKNPQNELLSVLIQHGNYISVYANLRSISVRKGTKVKTKQKIGVIHTDKTNGKTILKFQIWNNDQKMDPALWIDGM